MENVLVKAGEKRGMTLVELIVTLAIMLILTSMMIPNYREYQKNTVLNNLTQDVALSVRLAQTYGLTVRDAGGDNFQTSYGIRFSEATPAQYFIFRDTNRATGGFQYSGLAGDRVEEYELNNGYNISNVCGIRPDASEDCFSGGDRAITWMDIVFDRPKPDAYFTSSLGGSLYEEVAVTVESPNGDTKEMRVLLTGYISTN